MVTHHLYCSWNSVQRTVLPYTRESGRSNCFSRHELLRFHSHAELYLHVWNRALKYCFVSLGGLFELFKVYDIDALSIRFHYFKGKVLSGDNLWISAPWYIVTYLIITPIEFLVFDEYVWLRLLNISLWYHILHLKQTSSEVSFSLPRRDLGGVSRCVFLAHVFSFGFSPIFHTASSHRLRNIVPLDNWG